MRKITEEEFNQKYYQYKNTIYSIAYTYLHNQSDADDVVQDVFMKYLDSNVVFPTENDEKYWLIRVVINTSKSFLTRSWKKKVTYDEKLINNIKEECNDSDTMFELVYQLPPKYKDVIILFYYENLSLKEIAESLYLSLSAVKKRLERARNILREKGEKNEKSR